MNTPNILNDITPAMKAKLDPNYRRKTRLSEPAATFRMTQETAKYTRTPFLPFTSHNRASRVTGRLI